MKRKRLLSLTALCTCACLLAGCTDTPSVSFKNYWFKNAGIVTYGTETLTYKVEPSNISSGLSGNYTVNYSNGKYVTSLTAKEDGTYLYETEFSMDVSFTFGRETSQTFTDVSKTSSVFKQDAKLTPVKSTKEYVSHSPANNATSLATCYATYEYSVETNYNGGGGKSIVTNEKTGAKVSNNFTFEKDYTPVDNEHLLLSLRGISQSPTTYACYVYAPFSVQVQQVDATFGSKVKGKEFSYQKDGTSFKGVIPYYPVTLTINAKNEGASQTVWIAETDNPDLNTHRNVILRFETPLAYSMGALVYTLESAVFSK